MKISAIALNTFREAVRNKILYTAVLFALVLVGVSAFFGSVSIGSQEKVIKDFGLFSLSFFGAIIAILSGVSLLNKELKQKTIYNILSKPVDRWQFIIGKYVGLTFTVSVLVCLMGLGLVFFVAIFENKIDWLLFQAILFILMEVAVVSAIAIFFSSVVVTTTLTGIFTLGTYIAGRSISYLKYYLESHDSSNAALVQLINILDWIIPDLTLFGIQNKVVYGIPASAEEVLWASLYCVSYVSVTLILATLVFDRRELT